MFPFIGRSSSMGFRLHSLHWYFTLVYSIYFICLNIVDHGAPDTKKNFNQIKAE